MKRAAIRKRKAVPARPRAIRWVPGRVVVFRLRAKKFAVLQMLASPSMAIMSTIVGGPERTASIQQAIVGEVYRVLAVHRSLLRACEETGVRAPPVASEVAYYSRSPTGIYSLWSVDGSVRSGVSPDECRGLEVMAVWDEWNLRDRLVSHFLKGGYEPEVD